jgi:hypothetical protein
MSSPTKIHPLVRDLYKRALHVGKDYPLGMDYVRNTWKQALRNPENCPSCYTNNGIPHLSRDHCEQELHKAVGKGRYMIREMIGVIQLKKYRSMKQRYDAPDSDTEIRQILQHLQDKANNMHGGDTSATKR